MLKIFSKKRKLEEIVDNSKFEKCVLCHEKTEITISTPIEEREYYIEGIGQTHYSCYIKLYPEENQNRPLSY